MTEVVARAARKAYTVHSMQALGVMDSIQPASLKVNLARLNERGIRDLFCLMCWLEAAYLGVRLQGV